MGPQEAPSGSGDLSDLIIMEPGPINTRIDMIFKPYFLNLEASGSSGAVHAWLS